MRLILIWSFAVLGLGLLVMALLQIRYGLSPLRQGACCDNRAHAHGGRAGSPSRCPLEVQPHGRGAERAARHIPNKQAEEARRHAGNLAHALKTPLTVLTNAATARAPDLGEAVMRETRTMQRHVDHHLARARAVGRRAAWRSARTNVMASAEAASTRAVAAALSARRGCDIAGDKEPPRSRVERQDLDELLGNLVENAAKYGGGSVFRRRSPRDGAMAEILVEEDVLARHCGGDRDPHLRPRRPARQRQAGHRPWPHRRDGGTRGRFGDHC
ncbi:MAG: hypothetical protein U5M50_10875 [Sphingobium sp.]|nr:hypothetical protein [Sphingobium sp.]